MDEGEAAPVESNAADALAGSKSAVMERWGASAAAIRLPLGDDAAGVVDQLEDTLRQAARTGTAVADTAREVFAAAGGAAQGLTAIRAAVLLRHAVRDSVPFPTPAAAQAVEEVLDVLTEVVAEQRSERLRQDALTDPLTGLGNRRAADDVLERHVGLASRHDRPVAVVVVDLDGLKSINDTFGHAAGDDALRRIARALESSLRRTDAAFRTGGDEFVLVLPETDAAAAEALVQRVRDDGVAPSFSHGVAVAPAEAATVGELLELADARLYAGRHLAAVPLPPPARRRSLAIPSLRPALVGFSAAASALWILGGGTAAAILTTFGALTLLAMHAKPVLLRQQWIGRRRPMAGALAAVFLVVGALTATAVVLDDVGTRRTKTPERPSADPVASPPDEAATTTAPSTAPTPSSDSTPPAETTRPPSTTRTTSIAAPTTSTTLAPPPSPSPTLRASNAPVARDDRATAGQRGWTVIPVLANDSAGSSEFDIESLELISGPSAGAGRVRGGEIRYRPDRGTTSDSFDYRICTRGGACVSATASISIESERGGLEGRSYTPFA